MPDHEKLADDVETDLALSRQTIAQAISFAAHRALATIIDGAKDAGTGQLADLAYAYACLEGARRGVLPSAPPPNKSASGGPLNDILASEPPRRPTSSPQPGLNSPPLGYTTRSNP